MVSKAVSDLFDLSGKTALVTAAGQGMGEAIARRLAEAGANIVVSHKHLDQAEKVAEDLRAIAVDAIPALMDVTDLEQMESTVTRATEHFGGIDILVNTAGGMHPFTPFIDVTPDTFQSTLDKNLKSTYFLTQMVAKSMIATKRPGNIVNIASIAGFRPDFQLAAYNAAKAGVISLTHSLCAELGPYNIRINSVVPGPTRTTNISAILDAPEIKSLIEQRTPLGKPAEPEDIANAVLFCASPAAKHMNGGMIVIDGGFMWT